MPKIQIMIGFLALGCTRFSPDEQLGTLIHSVHYETQWKPALPADTDPWRVENNLGYVVQFDEAYLVHYAVQLIPCEEDTGLTWLPLLIDTAFAGHGGENDASISPVPVVESIHSRKTTNLGRASFLPTRYCEVHYLVGRADESTDNLPESHNMLNSSLYFRGTWEHDLTSTNGDIELATNLAHGIVLPLPETTYSGAITLALQRSTATENKDGLGLFDDIDFQQDNTTQQVWQLLLNLVNNVNLTVQE